MPTAIPEPDIYFGGSDIDKLEIPEYDTEWSDYGNALQVGTVGLAEGVNRLGEYVARQVGAEDKAEFFEGNARYWDTINQEQRAQYSPGAQQSLAKEFATTSEDAAWRDMSAVMLHATESLPATAVTMTPIGAAVRVGITSKAALAGIGAVSEGLLGAGYVAGDIAKEIEGMSPEQLNQIPGVADLRARDWSDGQIIDALKEQQQKHTVPAAAATRI